MDDLCQGNAHNLLLKNFMNFRDLKAAVNAAQLHDLADTSVDSVSSPDGVSLLVETRAEELAQAIEDLKCAEGELKDEQARCNEIEAERDALQSKLEDAQLVLAEIKEDGASVTLAKYREQAAECAAETANWKQTAMDHRRVREESERECKALRKRKGIASGVVRHHHELWVLLGYITQSKAEDWTRYKEDVRKMLEKINAA